MRRRRRRTRVMRKADAAAQVETVAMRKLAEAVQVDVVEQRSKPSVQRFAIDDDVFRHRGLVVADAGDQVQQAQCGGEAGFASCGRWQCGVGKADGFDQLRAVIEAIDKCGAGARRVVVGAHEMEALRNARMFETHSITSSAAARRL